MTEIYTEDKLEYSFQPVKSGRFNFEVNAAHDAHLALTSGPSESEPIIEIFLGGWDNSKCAMRFNKQKPEVAEVLMHDVVNGDWKKFWVSWDDKGTVGIGNAGEAFPFLSWTNPEPFHITHVGYRTSWGAEGDWNVEGMKFHTPDSSDYTFHPVLAGEIKFGVRCNNDAHVALTTAAAETDPMIEIMLGGWGNSKSAIRLNREKPNKSEAETPDVCNSGEVRCFWIRWRNGHISAGKAGDNTPLLEWENPEPFPVAYIGVRTAWGADGHWQLYCGGEAPCGVVPFGSGGSGVWVHANGPDIPANSVKGGQDGDDDVYVGRAHHEGELIPGKVIPSHGVCYIPWGGQEVGVAEFEVLTNPGAYTWVPTSGSAIPDGAQEGGKTADGEVLYVGRAPHEGTMPVGKVHPSHGTCYIPYGGAEHGYPEYEILVRQ